MAGYCETGRVAMASPPASMTTMAMTQAKIGRSMKKRDSMTGLALGGGGRGRDLDRLDRRPRLHLLQSFNDHPLACAQSPRRQPVVADGLADGDDAAGRLAAGPNHKHGGLTPCIAADGGLRDQDRGR